MRNVSSGFLSFPKGTEPLVQKLSYRVLVELHKIDPGAILDSITLSKGKIYSAPVFPGGSKIYLCNLISFPSFSLAQEKKGF